MKLFSSIRNRTLQDKKNNNNRQNKYTGAKGEINKKQREAEKKEKRKREKEQSVFF